MDHSTIHPASQPLAHLIDLFVFRGAPKNLNENHPVEILVNHGYCVGYAPSRFQPLWAAYRVSGAERWVDYKRPHLYYADKRLAPEARLPSKTFGKTEAGVQLNVGHMVPNEAINQQFGRLAQMETFFMSNMSPQYGSLNSGVWLKLENDIRSLQNLSVRDHVWIVSGPIFGDDPEVVTRDGKDVPIPKAYYCISIDPFRYPYHRLSNVEIACFIFPQDAPRKDKPSDPKYASNLATIQQRTGLVFVPGYDGEIGARSARSAAPQTLAPSGNRLVAQMELSALAEETETEDLEPGFVE